MEPAKKLALSVGRLTVYLVALGAVAGVISGLVTSANIRLNTLAPLIAIILCYVSYKLAGHEKIKNRFLMVPGGSQGDEKANVALTKFWRYLTTGFWAYFITWFIFWIMVYTLLVAA